MWGLLHKLLLPRNFAATPEGCLLYGCEMERSADHLNINQEERSIIQNLRAAKALYDENKQLRETLEQIAEMSGAMVWRKDVDGIYEYCNRIICRDLFKLPESCHDFAIGKSDIDLINYYRESTGNQHTFGELCASTDQHCMELGQRALYLEMGWIDGIPMILSVRKSPIYDDDGKCIGTVGMGIDVSYKCDELLLGLFTRIEVGEVEQLAPGVWWVKKEEVECKCVKPGVIPDYTSTPLEWFWGGN